MIRKTNIVFAAVTHWRVIIALIISGILSQKIQAVEIITNASDIISLSAKDALTGLPVSITGVVTATESNWVGRFFLQDASGGVFADNVNHPGPAVGDLVRVTGVSHPGGYAPVI